MKCDITLCMIVKDEAERLDACLASVYEYVEEIIVVDTGSTDSTDGDRGEIRSQSRSSAVGK